jgi:PilZ domain
MSLPQLFEGQPARVDIGESLPCRVIGFTGLNIVLALEQQPVDDEELDFEKPAYLLIDTGGRMQALRGHVDSLVGQEMVLRLSDRIQLGQRRIFSRAPIPLPVVVKSRDGAEWTTVTRDVSAGGVCVARAGATSVDGALELRIRVANHEVVAEAIAMRVTTDDLGLRFEQIERDDRLLLASLALAYHRRR